MSTRRIGTFTNLSPIQEISINPFSELNSDNINEITKSISNNEDGAVFGLDVISPNFDNDSLKHYKIIDDNRCFITGEWEFDENHCTILGQDTDPNQVNGFRIEDITKCSAQRVNFKIGLDTLHLTKLKGRNVQIYAKFSFHVVSGCPKRIYAYVNDSNNYLEYPDNSVDNTHEIKVIYNLRENYDYLNLALLFALDPSDIYTDHIIKPSEYSGQSYVEINNIKISFDIVNYKEIFYISKNCDITEYPTPYIHPTHRLDITSGIAIKDNAVIDIKSKTKECNIPLSLDLNSNTSWIRNNPYTLNDFDDGGGLQNGCLYNRTSFDDPLKLTEGTINTNTNLLEFRYKNKIFNPSDEYELTRNDYELDFTVDNEIYEIIIPETNVPSNDAEIYGQVGYIYSKITNKVIKKIDLEYNPETGTLPRTVLNFCEHDLKIPWTDISEDTIGIVLSAGPVKVPGKLKDINNNMVKWGYVVMYYTYYKNPKPNKSYIGLIRDTDINDLRYREDYLILAKVRFITPNTVDIISYEDRQQIFHSSQKSTNVSYGQDLTPEESSYWIDPNGIISIPMNVSDALTKLIKWIPLWIEKYSRVEKSVTDNLYKLFVHNQVIKWVWDDENGRGDLVSSGYYIDVNSTFKPAILAAWNEELNTLLPLYLKGLNGQILFYDDTEDCNLKFDWVMKNGVAESNENDIIYVCKTQNDLDLCKAPILFPTDDIYNNWEFFGHTTDGISSNLSHPPLELGITEYPATELDQNGNPLPAISSDTRFGAEGWRYHNDMRILFNPVNSADYCGYVSDKEYLDYDILVRCYTINRAFDFNGTHYDPMTSAYDDDDFLGVVAGFTTDEDGFQHTITFLRTAGNTGSQDMPLLWSCSIDPIYYYLNNVNSCRKICTFNESVNESGRATKWKNAGDGALIHITRKGNVFRACTSKLVVNGVYDPLHPENSTIVESPESEIILNLDDLTYQTYGSDPIKITDPMSIKLLKLFKDKPCKYGIASHSQGYSAFDIIKYPGNRKIIDLVNNKVWQYVYSKNDWVEIDQSIYDAFGRGKFSYNSVTKKLFWQKEQEIIEIDLNVQKFPEGLAGEVLYRTNSDNINPGVEFDPILHTDVYVCETSIDAQTCMNYEISENLVIDKESNKTYKFENDVWTEIGTADDYLLPGREYYNSVLDNLYWCDLEKNIVRIGSKPKESDILNLIDNSVDIQNSILNLIYPIGSIYISTIINEIQPFNGRFGKWVRISQGRCLWGYDENDPRLPGTLIEPELPNIKGRAGGTAASAARDPSEVFTPLDSDRAANSTSAIYLKLKNDGTRDADNEKTNEDYSDQSGGLSSGRGAGYYGIGFNANRYNSIYKDGGKVQPPAIIVNIWQRVDGNAVIITALDYDGTNLGTKEVPRGSIFGDIKSVLDDLKVTHSNLTFFRWNTDDDTVINENITTKAVYLYDINLQINQDTKYGKIYLNNAKITDDEYSPATIACKTNDIIEIKGVPDDTETSTNTFVEWQDHNTSDTRTINLPDIIEGLNTYIATFRKVVWYIFDANGGTGDVPASQSSEHEITLPDSNLTKPDHYFVGWAIDPQSETYMLPNSTYRSNVNVTLYAIYLIQYNVRFDPNGGEGTVYDMVCNAGVEYDIPELSFTKEGQDIVGFNTDSSATEPTITIDGKFKDLTTVAGDTITLYAIWKDATIKNVNSVYTESSNIIQSKTRSNFYGYLETIDSRHLKRYRGAVVDGDADIFDVLRTGNEGFVTSTIPLYNELNQTTTNTNIIHGTGGTRLQDITFKNYKLITKIEFNPYTYCYYNATCNVAYLGYTYNFMSLNGTPDKTVSFLVPRETVERHLYTAGRYFKFVMTIKDKNNPAFIETIEGTATSTKTNTVDIIRGTSSIETLTIDFTDAIISKNLPISSYTSKIEFIESIKSDFSSDRYRAEISGIKFYIDTINS